MNAENTTESLDHLSKNQMREYREAFEIFSLHCKTDENQLSRQKLSDAMRMLGLNPKEEEIQYIINTTDLEGDGQVEFEHFVTMMEKERIPDEYEALRQAFNVFDADNTGFIEAEELRLAMEFVKMDTKKLTESDLQEMFSFLGIDVNRKITYREFKTFISANIALREVEDHQAREEQETDQAELDGEEPGPSRRLIDSPTYSNYGNQHEVPVNIEHEPGNREPGPSSQFRVTSRV